MSPIGNYQAEVELADGRTFRTDEWGFADWTEEHTVEVMRYQFEDGNYSCDCNKRLFLAREEGREPDDGFPCGEELTIKRVTMLCPDGRRVLVWQP